jgi:hypothetical protein
MKLKDSTIIMVVTGFYMTCLIVANITAGKRFCLPTLPYKNTD